MFVIEVDHDGKVAYIKEESNEFYTVSTKAQATTYPTEHDARIAECPSPIAGPAKRRMNHP